MNLYVIGEPQGHGPYAIGLAADSKAKLAELQAERPDTPLKLLRDKELKRGWDELAGIIVKRELAMRPGKNGWYDVPSSFALVAVDKAFRATTGNPLGPTDWASVMATIRHDIFGCSLEVIGTVAGCNASTASRWESGELVPGIEEIKRLRNFALRHGLRWRDSIIFDPAEARERAHVRATREALRSASIGETTKGPRREGQRSGRSERAGKRGNGEGGASRA